MGGFVLRFVNGLHIFLHPPHAPESVPDVPGQLT